MARARVCFEDVESAAEKIIAQGDNPTIEKIRRELGSGSNSTISKYLNDWRSSRLSASTYHSSTSIPPDPVNAAVNQVWEQIRTESATEIKAYRDTADKEIELAQTERDEAIASREFIQNEFEIGQKRLNQVTAEKELLNLDLKALQQEHILLEERHKNLKDQYDLFKQETNNQINLLQSINKNEIDDKQSTIAILQETHRNAVNKLIEVHENYRQQYMVEIDTHKVEQQNQKKILEKLMSHNQSIKIELEESKAQIKIVTRERDALKNDCHEKNTMIDKITTFNSTIQLVLNEVKNIKNSEYINEMILTLSQVNKTMDSHELKLSSILNALKKTNKISRSE